jgi:hypothetical protein
VEHYLDELARRRAERQGQRLVELTEQIRSLTVAVTIMTLAITEATIISLVLVARDVLGG